MAGHKAVGRTGKTTVGDQRDVVAEAAPLKRGGHSEHLAHARSADRSFAADDDHVARGNLPMRDRIKGRFFAVEHFGSPLETEIALSGELHHAAFRRDIAVANAKPAACLQRAIGGDDDPAGGDGIFSEIGQS